MVLEMKVPQGESFASLRPLLPVFFSYVLSFLYVGIHWNNHHHMLHVTTGGTGSILWANLHCCSGCHCFRPVGSGDFSNF
jgi:uncharacterized membrane protein